jgi:hypothetical protein
VKRFAELDALADPELAAAWGVIGGRYRALQKGAGFDEGVVLRGMATAHQLRHPTRVIPGLDEIAFETAEEFARRAGEFLGDAGRRASIAVKLRGEVVREFSYDARWGRFLGHIARVLTQA